MAHDMKNETAAAAADDENGILDNATSIATHVETSRGGALAAPAAKPIPFVRYGTDGTHHLWGECCVVMLAIEDSKVDQRHRSAAIG